jgi:hypothetical protein
MRVTHQFKISAFALILGSSFLFADEEPEVLARGPVHEAYAEPVDGNAAPSPLVPKQPPEAIEELPPDQKPEGQNVQWIPGYFQWDEERSDFIWISGFWRVPPPGRVWVPGNWQRIGDSWQWAPGMWRAVDQPQTEIEYLPQPPATIDLGPSTPSPTEQSIYIPGSWVYRNRYAWRPGYWIESRPGWVFVSPHYRWTPAGYIYIDGYWDRPLVDRGLLFAPVYIPRAVYVRPQYVYTPTIVVREQAMFGALFVRRGFSSYYFGDYFGPRYVQSGYTAWVGNNVAIGVTVGRSYYYDPLYSYYRVQHRHDPFWNGGISTLYVDRYQGRVPLPPRTFNQQNIVVNNLNQNNTTIINNTTINNVSMLSNLNQVNVASENRVRPVDLQARQLQQQQARQLTNIAVQRGQLERQLAATPMPPRVAGVQSGTPLPPRTVKLDVPAPVVARAQAPIANPAPPIGNQGSVLPPRTPNPATGTVQPPRIPGNPGNPKMNPPTTIPPNPMPQPVPTPIPPRVNPSPVVPKVIPPNPMPQPVPTPIPPRVNPTPVVPKVIPPNPRPQPVPTPIQPPRVNPQPIVPPKLNSPLPAPLPPRINPPPVVPPKVNPQPAPVTPRNAPVPAPVMTPRPNPTPTPVAPRITPQPAPVAPRVNPQPAPVAPRVNPQPAPVVPRVNPQPAPVAPRITPQPAPVAPRVNPQPTPPPTVVPRANPAPAPVVQPPRTVPQPPRVVPKNKDRKV